MRAEFAPTADWAEAEEDWVDGRDSSGDIEPEMCYSLDMLEPESLGRSSDLHMLDELAGTAKEWLEVERGPRARGARALAGRAGLLFSSRHVAATFSQGCAP